MIFLQHDANPDLSIGTRWYLSSISINRFREQKCPGKKKTKAITWDPRHNILLIFSQYFTPDDCLESYHSLLLLDMDMRCTVFLLLMVCLSVADVMGARQRTGNSRSAGLLNIYLYHINSACYLQNISIFSFFIFFFKEIYACMCTDQLLVREGSFRLSDIVVDRPATQTFRFNIICR